MKEKYLDVLLDEIADEVVDDLEESRTKKLYSPGLTVAMIRIQTSLDFIRKLLCFLVGIELGRLISSFIAS